MLLGVHSDQYQNAWCRHLYLPAAILTPLGTAVLLVGAKANPDEIIRTPKKRWVVVTLIIFLISEQVWRSGVEVKKWNDNMSFWKNNFEEHRDFKGSGSVEMIHLNYVRALLTEEKYFEGLTIMREAVKKRANMDEVSHIALSTIYFDIGLTLKEAGEASYAIEAYQQSIEHDGNHTKTLMNLGNAFIELGRTDTALTYLLKVVELNENDTQGWFAIGNAYYTDNSPVEALTAYKRCADVAPEEFHRVIGDAIARAMLLKERLENEAETA